jgi:succinate dehydrogenase/fumarate reductase flavoprotein subunit
MTKRINSNAIILTTGGFSHDFSEKSLLKEFAPELNNFPTTNGPQASGDGIRLARKTGAHLVDMDKI